MIETWEDCKGVIPRRSNRLLPPGFAVNAVNCNLRSGEIRPFNGPSVVRTPSKGAAVLSIYLFESVYWLNWLTDVDLALSPVIGDIYNRFYWTGDGYPKKISQALGANDTEADLPQASFHMGVVAPATAPDTVDDAAGGGSPETRVYVYTYVTAFGEEGQPSPASVALDVEANETVTVDNFEADPDASYNIVFRRIYRSLSGTSAAAYQFVTEIPLATTSYDDSLTGSQLGEILPSLTWAEPPATMKGLALMGNGTMAGFVGKNIYFSEPYLPHAWPDGYALATEHNIVSLAVMGRGLLITTEGDAHLVYGEHPSRFSKEIIGPGLPCISKRGTVSTPSGVLYPCPDGLVLVSSNGAMILTEEYYTRDEWEALGPQNLVASLYQGRYYGFFGSAAEEDRRGIIYDPGDPSVTVTFLNKSTDAVFADKVTNQLYMVLDEAIQRWEGDPDNPLSYKWQGHYSSSWPNPFGAARVQANLDSILSEEELAAYQAEVDAVNALNTAWYAASPGPEALNGAEINAIPQPLGGIGFQEVPTIPTYSMQISVFADEVLKYQRFITSRNGFRIKGGFRAREWDVLIEGTAAIEKTQIASTLQELKTR